MLIMMLLQHLYVLVDDVVMVPTPCVDVVDMVVVPTPCATNINMIKVTTPCVDDDNVVSTFFMLMMIMLSQHFLC